MIQTVVVVIIVVSAVWVYFDATAHKIGKIKDAGGLFNMSAGAWGIVTLWLWIVGFPSYVIKRRALIARAKATPIEVKGRWVKVAMFGVVGILWILGTIPKGA